MSSQTYRGVVRQGTVVLSQKMPLADGTEVVITPVNREQGTAAAVIAAVEAPPHVPTAWVDELEQIIAQGERPPSLDNPFTDPADGGETR